MIIAERKVRRSEKRLIPFFAGLMFKRRKIVKIS